MPSFVLIFGLNPQGLFLLREYARRGFRVIGIARKGEVGIKSKFGQIRILHNDGDLPSLVSKVLDDELGDCQAFITSDYFLNLISNDHPNLLLRVPFTTSSLETLKTLTSKQATYEYAERLNIVVPRTLGLEQYEDFESNLFPLILKWNETPIGVRVPFKTKIIYDYDAAKESASEHAALARYLILQQVVDGVDLSYAAFYDHGKEIFGCVVRRTRQAPMGLSSHVSDYKGTNAEECLQVGKMLMEDLHVNGFAEVEFRLGHDGRLYLIEVNPRIWGWAKFLKLKFPNFQDVLIDPKIKAVVNSDFCKWFNLLRDLKAMHLLLGRDRTLRTFADFVRSYRGTKIFDVFELDDPRPFFYQMYKGWKRSAK